MSASGQQRAVRLPCQSPPVYPNKADDFRVTLDFAEGPTVDSCIANGCSHSRSASARAKNASGILRPISFALFRLTASSNFVGCSMGKSLGRSWRTRTHAITSSVRPITARWYLGKRQHTVVHDASVDMEGNIPPANVRGTTSYCSETRMSVVECDVPSESALGKALIERADFRDAYRAPPGSWSH